MAGLSRREFLLLGVATGATAAVGVILPVSIATRDQVTATPDPTTPTTTPTTLPPTPTTQPQTPIGLVATFPKVRVAALSDVGADPIAFEYPLQGQSNVLVKLDKPAVGGSGPDEDIVAFSSICTHMGCVLTDFVAEHAVLGPCPCHFSTFDLSRNGQVTLGQASQNLPQVVLSIEDEDVYAVGLLRLVYGHSDSLVGRSPVSSSLSNGAT